MGAPIQELGEDFTTIGECTLSSCTLVSENPPSFSSWVQGMYDLHEALEKCDLGVDREALLLDSLIFGDSHIHTSLDLPGKKLQQDQFRDEMAKLLRDWRAERWSAV